MSIAGRSCPLRYRYHPSVFNREPAFTAETLYVVGGLYGNVEALWAILQLKDDEERRGGRVAVIFNGDFNWFDVGDSDFREVSQTVLAHRALKGNVEEELDTSDEHGCGCGYPSYVDDSVVAHSNQIMARLRETAERSPALTRDIAGLPLYETVGVADERIAVLHGDPESLAGWKFSVEAMEPADHALRAKFGCAAEPMTTIDQVKQYFRDAQVSVFASTHTGLPFAQNFRVDGSERLVINNGSAGLPNFSGMTYGLITRISADPRPPIRSLYGIEIGSLRCDGVPVFFDHSGWVKRFLRSWPKESAAYISYFDRIVRGPDYSLTHAVRGQVSPCRARPLHC